MTEEALREELIALIEPTHPLPPFKDWAIATDFAVILAKYILEHKPPLVMELGSGLSTLVIGYALRKAGSGRLISIEHEREWLEKSELRLAKHGLTDMVELLYCPLSPCNAVESRQLWYTIPPLTEKIDLLVIDGPPAPTVGREARHPTLPALWDSLAENAVIMLDDASRECEWKMARLWKQTYALEHTYLKTKKGTSILRRAAA